MFRTKKKWLGVIRPCIFSNRAYRLLSSCLMNGLGSLNQGESETESVPACRCGGRPVDGSVSIQAARTAAAPRAIIRRRNWRRFIPRDLTNSQRDCPSDRSDSVCELLSFMLPLPLPCSCSILIVHGGARFTERDHAVASDRGPNHSMAVCPPSPSPSARLSGPLSSDPPTSPRRDGKS